VSASAAPLPEGVSGAVAPSKRPTCRERQKDTGASMRVTLSGGGGAEYFVGSPNMVVQPMHAKNAVS